MRTTIDHERARADLEREREREREREIGHTPVLSVAFMHPSHILFHLLYHTSVMLSGVGSMSNDDVIIHDDHIVPLVHWLRLHLSFNLYLIWYDIVYTWASINEGAARARERDGQNWWFSWAVSQDAFDGGAFSVLAVCLHHVREATATALLFRGETHDRWKKKTKMFAYRTS